MKRLTTLSLLVLSAIVLTACGNQGGKPQVAVVDAAVVFKQSKAGQQAMSYLQELSKSLQEKVQKAQQAAEGSQNETSMQAFQQAVNEYQSTLGGEQQRLVGLLNERFNAVVEKYRKEAGLGVVLAKEAVMAFDPAADISAKIVEALDKENIDLKLPKVEKAAEPAAAAAPAAPEKADEKAAPEKAPEKQDEKKP